MLEICIDDIAGLDAAVTGGADRLELCSALFLGGLTPPPSLIRAAMRAPIDTHMMIRPREGGFCYSAGEADAVAADIDAAAQAGLAGIVIGANRPDRTLDADMLAQFIAHARALAAARGRPLSLTLHRAFDLCPDLSSALDTAIALGFDTILTSGGAVRASDAVAMLTQLHQRAAGRIAILAGSGIDATSAPAILAAGVRDLHASCRSPAVEDDAAERRLGFVVGRRRFTDGSRVRALKDCMNRVSGQT